jgi:hypothetical protein
MAGIEASEAANVNRASNTVREANRVSTSVVERAIGTAYITPRVTDRTGPGN